MAKINLQTLMYVSVIAGIFVGALWMFGVIGGATQNVVFSTTGDGSVPVGSGQAICGDSTTLPLSIASLSPANSSTSYNSPAVRIVAAEGPVTVGSQSKAAIATGTLTAGTTLAYTSVNVPCSAEAFSGTVYALSDTTDDNSAAATYTINGKSGVVLMQNTLGDELRLTLRNSELVSISANATEDPTENAATAMSAGDSRTGFLDVQGGNVGSSVFGGHGLGALWVIDTVDAAAFSNNGVTLSSGGSVQLNEIPCSTYPKASDVLSGNKCYWSKEIGSSMALSRLSYNVANDGGSSAGASSDPTITICDLQYVEQTGPSGPTVKIDCYDNSGTDVGQSNSVATIDNS